MSEEKKFKNGTLRLYLEVRYDLPLFSIALLLQKSYWEGQLATMVVIYILLSRW